MNTERWNNMMAQMQDQKVIFYCGANFELWSDAEGKLHYFLLNDRGGVYFAAQSAQEEAINYIANSSEFDAEEFGAPRAEEPREIIEQLAAEIAVEENFGNASNWLFPARTKYYENIKNAPGSLLIADKNGVRLDTAGGERIIGINKQDAPGIYRQGTVLPWTAAMLYYRLKCIDDAGITIMGGPKLVFSAHRSGLVFITSPYAKRKGMEEMSDTEAVWDADAVDIATGKQGKVSVMFWRYKLNELGMAPEQIEIDNIEPTSCSFFFPKFFNTSELD